MPQAWIWATISLLLYCFLPNCNLKCAKRLECPRGVNITKIQMLQHWILKWLYDRLTKCRSNILFVYLPVSVFSVFTTFWSHWAGVTLFYIKKIYLGLFKKVGRIDNWAAARAKINNWGASGATVLVKLLAWLI